jgi:hypothetical protein
VVADGELGALRHPHARASNRQSAVLSPRRTSRYPSNLGSGNREHYDRSVNGTESFRSGSAFLADGRMFIAGGQLEPFVGVPTATYDARN